MTNFWKKLKGLKLRKAHLPWVIVIGVMGMVATTAAYFLSSVSASNQKVEVGTLRLRIDSTRAHEAVGNHVWNGGGGGTVAPYEAYTIAEDVQGISLSNEKIEPWSDLSPGPYVPFQMPERNGKDEFVSGNRSFWVAFHNVGSLPMKVKSNLTTGRWSLAENHPVECKEDDLNHYPVLQLRHIHFYAANACEGSEECENISLALETQGSQMASGDGEDLEGNPVSQPVSLKTGNSPMIIDPQHFIVARFDVNFDNELGGAVPAEVQPCYQGAQFTYDLQATAFQVDAPW